jgi:hypothetical protein
MKKSLLAICTLLGSLSFAQNCSELFISEYVEGWSNNKALEIYNPTNQDIDLSEYFVSRYSNGSNSATVANSVQLSGTVGAHDVYVAVIDKQDPNGTGQEAPVWDSLQSKADGFYCPVYTVSNAFYWNGNDAILLAKGTLPTDPNAVINPTNVSGFAFVDIFGKIGENPADETGSSAGNQGAWSTVFPYSTGQGVLATKDHSMIRKSSIEMGTTTPVSFFDPLLEWDTIPAVIVRLDENGDTLFGTSGNPILDGNWNSLGMHDCSCNPAGINENEAKAILVFPNPSNGIINLSLHGQVTSIRLVNAFGKTVHFMNNVDQMDKVQMDLSKLHGIYFIQFDKQNGQSETKRVILR